MTISKNIFPRINENDENENEKNFTKLFANYDEFFVIFYQSFTDFLMRFLQIIIKGFLQIWPMFCIFAKSKAIAHFLSMKNGSLSIN